MEVREATEEMVVKEVKAAKVVQEERMEGMAQAKGETAVTEGKEEKVAKEPPGAPERMLPSIIGPLTVLYS